MATVPDLQVFGEDPRFDDLADQPAVDRITVPLHRDQAAGVHASPDPLGRIQPPLGQRSQPLQFFSQPRLAAAIQLLEELIEIASVLIEVRKVPAAAQQQRLVQRTPEAIVTLLHISVFVRLAGLDLAPIEGIVAQQGLIALLKICLLDQVINRSRHPIGAVEQGHAAQLPQRILQPFTQAGEALRVADRACLPVRIRQHEVVQHVRKGLAGNGDLQIGQVSKIRFA